MWPHWRQSPQARHAHPPNLYVSTAFFFFFWCLSLILHFFHPPPAAPKPYQTSQTPTNVKSTLSISPFSDLFEEAKLGTAVVQHRAVSTPKPVIQGAHILFRLDNWDDPAYLHLVKQKLSSLLSRIFLK